MAETYDQSHLDRKYFIDREKYNCPFCNRKSITYNVIEHIVFDWSQDKKVYGYLVQCGGDTCQKTSFHLSNYRIDIMNELFYRVHEGDQQFHISKIENVDELFFYHQPTTFFTIDNRVNEKIRKLVSEAEGCSKMNYLIGASGCLRKAIYELLELENIPKTDPAGGIMDYADRVKVLKPKYPTVPPEYFDALANIQGMTSEQLHEGDWEPWTQSEFHYLVEITKEVLTEVYVRPQDKAAVLQKLLSLKPQKETKQQKQQPPIEQ
ncbi:MAG: hypothetical protein ACOYMZ_03475 [Minisyncoccia bacterium]